jgi:hypothetical protein
MTKQTDEEITAGFHQAFETNLLGQLPENWMLHGPTKRYVDEYLYHEPTVGIVASYTPTEYDVTDHFGLFRGVDQIEAFAQASIVSCGTFLECRKMKITPSELAKLFIPAFISIGPVYFHSYLEKGQTFINIGIIKFYKWRQMVCNGRIYKIPKGFNLHGYFKDYNEARLLAYDVPNEFILVAELFDVTGRGIKKEMFEKIQ